MYHSRHRGLGPSQTPPPRLPLLRAAPHSPLLGAPPRGLLNSQPPPSRPWGSNRTGVDSTPPPRTCTLRLLVLFTKRFVSRQVVMYEGVTKREAWRAEIRGQAASLPPGPPAPARDRSKRSGTSPQQLCFLKTPGASHPLLANPTLPVFFLFEKKEERETIKDYKRPNKRQQ